MMELTVNLNDVRIQTDRLILRGFRYTDLRDLFSYASVPGVGELAGWRHHQSLDESSIALERFIQDGDALAIWHKEDMKVIGSVGLHRSWAEEDPIYKHMRIKEIGYVLSKPYWGKGYMPEAASALIEYAFNDLNLDVLTCAHFKSNLRSERVIHKLGFHYVSEGLFHSKALKQTLREKRYIMHNPNPPIR